MINKSVLNIRLNFFNGFILSSDSSNSKTAENQFEESEDYQFDERKPVNELPSVIDENLLKELSRAQDETQLNPLIQPASDRARELATQWIVWAKNKFSEISPYVVIPGDGGLIIDWKTKGGFVSVSFDEVDDEMDTIFSKVNGKKDSDNFSANKLEELLSALISYDTLSSELLTGDVSNYEKRTIFYQSSSASATHDFGKNLGSGWRSSFHGVST